ncbi:PaaX family transcriptional regulator C-terminal domain-containing protein [Paenibacillus validus]|uniref:PaaX family transcriptional regulator n=1 Tax=Paenibacillus validus TaxID=44253 RepID=UPI000FD6D069|nr:PaaX family transcriptional regulator C-terminal domain-containing protein [Paenibacillus validus]MED4602026.1 PaaX family transcriptional regulator C-terminal domain-containing protein [Paenibacillus validus]MED4607293.1 PaaX family transcriptional regulator C-terminal domain-containing protein [Paenibacillus validus]
MKPRSLMFTLFGDYVQYYGGEIWIGSLIKLMGEFGISESSVRGATLRMVQQELFQVRKMGLNSYYRLTDKGKRRIEDGVKKVYTITPHKWDGYWRILTYSMPEEKRELRNQVRKELVWTGFGMISNSTWVSPNPLERQTLEMIKTYQLEAYTMLFSASTVMSHSDSEVVKRGWDFEAIANEYVPFIQKYREKFADLQARIWDNSLTDRDCFIERTELVHEYRKFLFLDPLFPSELLPGDWTGNTARELFRSVHQIVSVGAVRYFESVIEQAPGHEVVGDREHAINPFVEM